VDLIFQRKRNDYATSFIFISGRIKEGKRRIFALVSMMGEELFEILCIFLLSLHKAFTPGREGANTLES
jgi:hypothetical protein